MAAYNPATHLEVNATLVLAVSPHAARHVHTEAMRTRTRQVSREWLAIEARDFFEDPNWRLADLVDNISVSRSCALRRIGGCRCSWYVTSQIAQELFDLRHIGCVRRMQVYRFEMVPRTSVQNTKDPNIRFFLSAASLNIDRARRRWPRANISPLFGAQGARTMAD